MSIPHPFTTAGQASPNISADAIDALIWESAVFAGTTDQLAIGASATGGGLLFNPSNSSKSALIYGAIISADANALVRVGLVGSVASGFVTTGTQVQPKHFQTSGSGLIAPSCVLYQNTAASAMTSFNMGLHVLASEPVQFYGGYANTVLRPGTGLQINVSGPTSAYHIFVTLAWAEFAVT